MSFQTKSTRADLILGIYIVSYHAHFCNCSLLCSSEQSRIFKLAGMLIDVHVRRVHQIHARIACLARFDGGMICFMVGVIKVLSLRHMGSSIAIIGTKTQMSLRCTETSNRVANSGSERLRLRWYSPLVLLVTSTHNS